MKGKTLIIIIVFIATSFLVPSSAHANAIVPLFIAIPLYIIASLPLSLTVLSAVFLITIVESIALCWILGLSFWYSLWIALASNLVSTLVGIFGIPIILLVLFLGSSLLILVIPEIIFLLPNIPFQISFFKLLIIIGAAWLIWKGLKMIFSVNRDLIRKSRLIRRLRILLLAPFLLIDEGDDLEDWMAPAVILLYLIPCFFVSWYIEGFIAGTFPAVHKNDCCTVGT